ncbi:MAG: hypothetical protein M3512_09205 [Bacteroidota bacterium]|nr:hypothetical protein [Bacteroidota bacterium]
MINNLFKLNKALFLCTAVLLFFTFGCNNEPKNENRTTENTVQEPIANNQQDVAEEPEEITTEDPATTTNYRPRVRRSHNKLKLDATSTSFKDLDENGNFILTRDDLFNGIFNTLDKKEDDKMTEEEFISLKKDFFINKNSNKISTFTEWDADGNGEISREEFYKKLNSLVDLEDGRSLAQGNYIVWDLDDDDKIEMLELENFVVQFDTNDN